ncbi:hypothetical protein H310_11989 [Aphanomyces invadans]|uniref:Uncharacterized protein n=1 Tax=Aphanomyces invadans TaxID=157072 RepID=A0A024TL62_9STRA|nr:hypothetical protein H310_11989 [Aphanomyces invadans]ETV94346.1 hypothetical protein H310_11989 [Aphanomyces invadans]|eukprot:XP_008877108.1 hypothetical protein H310_11989 [Aphanomyces invadans]
MHTTLQSPFRGYCLYKTGKCFNERAVKTNGLAHNLCKDHRAKQNLNQRRMDNKMRRKRDRSFSPNDRPAGPRSIPSPSYSTCPRSPPPHCENDHSMPSHQHPPSWRSEDERVVDFCITVPMPPCLRGPDREAVRARVVEKLFQALAQDEQVMQTANRSAWDMAMPPKLPSLASRRLSQFINTHIVS